MTGSFQYGASTAITITLASLGHSTTAGNQSTAVDNSADKFMDALVQLKFKLVAGTPASDQTVYVYAYGSEDGTAFPDGITGTSGAYTFYTIPNLTLLQTISAAAAGGLTFIGQPVSIALAFNGVMPRKWGIVVKNTTNLAFTATAGDHSLKYTGITILNQ